MPKITSTAKMTDVQTRTEIISYFRGTDLTNQPANVGLERSPDCLNMIRDVPGKVRKRMGYELVKSYGARQINGVFQLRDKTIVHAGTRLYIDDSSIYSAMADVKSHATRFNNQLWIQDGTKLLVYGEFEGNFQLKTAEQIAFTPEVSIGRRSTGGGETFQPVNMLSDKRTDAFVGEASVTVYQLSFTGLSPAAATAQKRTANDTWVDLVEGTHFTLNRTTGQITFTTAPGVTPVQGEDSIKVTYSKTNVDYKNRVNKCAFGICYGVGGAADRLFISGNADYPNFDFYSELNNGAYFGDLWYGNIGQKHSPIVGYSVINQYLATHKGNDDNERNIYLRLGELNSDGEAQFPLTGSIQGKGALSSFTFGQTAVEPMFLTSLGVCSTTPKEYTTERFVQNRSFYINNALCAEPGLTEAYACTFKDFYLLAVNGRVYVLDTLIRSAQTALRSEFQYEAYLWDNIPARVIYTIDDRLFFGTSTGRIYRFYDDPESIHSYSDNGTAIAARWDIFYAGSSFYKAKTLKNVAVKLAAYAATGCEIWTMKLGHWEKQADTGGDARFLSFANLSFSKFTFSSNTEPRTIIKKVKVKKFDAIQISIRNEELNEPMGIYEIGLEYTQAGNYKG